MNHTENATQEAAIHAPDTQSLWTDVVKVNVALTSVQLFFTLLQLIAFIGGMYWANYYIKERDRQDEQEKREREERDKIAEILSSEYDKIESENIPEEIRKTKAVFENMLICRWSDNNITGLDVLMYMCREESYQRCKTDLVLVTLHENLDAIWKLFRSFRIKLPLKGVCPESIREELGPLISDLGQLTASLVTGTKRATISTVLEYFDHSLEPGEYKREKLDGVPYIKELRCEYKKSVPTLKCCYEDAARYTDLEEDNRGELIRKLTALSCILQSGKEIEWFRDLVKDIQDIWYRTPSPFPQPLPRVDLDAEQEQKTLRVNVLHAVRVFLHWTHCDRRRVIDYGCFQNLLTVRVTQNLIEDAYQMMCEGSILNICTQLLQLRYLYSSLLKKEETITTLEKLEKDLGEFMKEHLKLYTQQELKKIMSSEQQTTIRDVLLQVEELDTSSTSLEDYSYI